ncbi:MAG: CoA transferase subunit A [Chloroflexi bacterium]|nr:CoA transferase subunit A [Chloroflexota bacterium]
MAVNKVFPSFAAAVADIPDGATIMMDGFGGEGGMASHLILALRDHGAKNLTIIGNTVGTSGFGTKVGRDFVHPGILVKNGQVKKAIASFPVSRSPSNPTEFERAYIAREVELEMVPQGTLAERIRAGGAGIGGFFTPTGVGTVVEKGKEKRTIGGKEHILEIALFADYALIRACKADKLGNLAYRGTSRCFNAIMATAARITIAEVDEIVEPGELDPGKIITPAIYVKRIVQRPKEG